MKIPLSFVIKLQMILSSIKVDPDLDPIPESWIGGSGMGCVEIYTRNQIRSFTFSKYLENHFPKIVTCYQVPHKKVSY